MLIAGLIAILVGAAAFIYGIAQRSSAEYVLASAFGAEEAAVVDTIFYIGIAVMVVGAILLVVHYVKKSKK